MLLFLAVLSIIFTFTTVQEMEIMMFAGKL